MKRDFKISIAIVILFIIKNNLILKTKFNNFLNIIDISIIIPIYNSEKFLSACLKSVISQSLRNIEIICIDDGSTDQSLRILKKYKNKDKRIIILQQKNKGPALARNNGIDISKGKYIAFMDSDDLYPNNFTLELMFNNAFQNKVLICGGGVINFNESNNKIQLLIEKNISFPYNNIIYYYDYQYDLFYQRFIYNTKFIKKNKLYFPNYIRYQDPPFFIKTMALAKKFYALSNITYYYRISKQRIMNREKVIDIFRGLNDCLSISKANNLFLLYSRILSHLNYEVIINETKKFEKDEKLREIISQILNNINYDLLIKEKQTFIIDDFYNQFK